MSDKSIRDPEMYARMSKPFETKEAMYEALDAFFTELYALRVKHKIPDVGYIICAKVEGDENSYVQSGHIGDASLAAPMLAAAYGQERARLTKALDDIVRGQERAGEEP
jgi:hypothetical protein